VRARPQNLLICVSHLTEIDQIKNSSMWPVEIGPFVSFFVIYTTHALSHIHERAYARLNCVCFTWCVCVSIGLIASVVALLQVPKMARPREGQTAEPSATETACRPLQASTTVGIAPLPLALEEFTD
jgi:hypothetical protein